MRTSVARFAGSVIVFALVLGLTPEALCYRLLRRLERSGQLWQHTLVSLIESCYTL